MALIAVYSLTATSIISLAIEIYKRYDKKIALLLLFHMSVIVFMSLTIVFGWSYGNFDEIKPIEVKSINESCVLVVFDHEDGRLIMFQYPQFYGLELVKVMRERGIYCEEVDE